MPIGSSPGATRAGPFTAGHRRSYRRGIEPPVAVSFDSRPDRPYGWQVQLRLEYVVNQVMLTHRGQPEEQVAEAIQDRLRQLGAVPNTRQVRQYARAISHLPPMPPPAPGSGTA